jgi:hypothetical protein
LTYALPELHATEPGFKLRPFISFLGCDAEQIQRRDAYSTMTKQDPFELGKHAAAQGIPAEANPFIAGTDEYALWSAGHEERASAVEASESEG